MINIILCDDDKFILQLAADRMKEAILKYKMEAQIACVARESGKVMQYLKSNSGIFLIFLDLDFGSGKLNGIDVAKQIKMICDSAKIVFVTNHKEMAMKVLASGVEPYGFLEKSTDMEKLSRGYFRYIQMAASTCREEKTEEDTLQLTVGIDETVTIQKRQILYVEAEKTISHGVTYHTMDGSCITVRDTMEHVLAFLGCEFIRVHRSMAVNRNYMIDLTGTIIQLSNGEEISCAVRKRSEVKKCLH